jgi:hypothetical protein
MCWNAAVRTVGAHHGQVSAKSIVGRRAVHDQACDCPQQIYFGVTHATALLLRRSKAVMLGFFDLYQRTTLPRTDACRDDPKRRV